jgi:membrane protein implicated in regulation of membrane protease activity
MSDVPMWWVLAGILMALELTTGSFYLQMLGLGAAAAALTATEGPGPIASAMQRVKTAMHASS